MKTVGLWIDLQKAVIVSATGQGAVIEFVHSDIDSRRWQLDVWKLPCDIRQRMSNDQLERFYKNVSGRVLDARSLFILGPGEAKGELRRRLGTDNFTGKIVGFESAGSMTEIQIVDRVHERFEELRALTVSGASGI